MDALDKLLPQGAVENRTLADIILEKIEASEAAKANGASGPQLVRKRAFVCAYQYRRLTNSLTRSGWYTRPCGWLRPKDCGRLL